MSPKLLRLAILITAGLLLTTLAWAGIPKTISYQGYLKQANGSPVNSPTKIRFSLYSSNPHRDNPIWRETQDNVDVRQGVYSVQLGTLEPITAPFDIRYWLGVSANNGPDMLPLQPLASVPYSFRSGCNPGDMINCYRGAPETINLGICRAGTRMCLPDGSGFGSCIGEFIPDPITGCNEPNCADMAKNQNETDVDCGGGLCPPCTSGKNCLLPADCLNLNCQNGICNDATPTCNDMYRNGLETDVDCGGLACGPCTIGKHCVANADCASQLCQGGICITNPCQNGVKDGKESDVDCGGSSCQPCTAGKTCAFGFDCQSGVCSAGGICQTPTCNDAVKNGSETDVDCGGLCSNKCSTSKNCLTSADCQSNYCDKGLCATPTCLDNVKNGTETDVDCGGNTCNACAVGKICNIAADCQSGVCNAGFCQNKLSQGTVCSSNNECQSSFCVDGVCCSSACSGTCQSCNLVGQVGTCSSIAAGTDPDNECSDQGQASCGTSGTCNGSGACAYYPAGTLAANGSCTAGISTLPSTCNGFGTVQAGGTQICSPYVCGANACRASCNVNNDCTGGYSCISGVCKKNAGQTCTATTDCATGFCTDGICCESACNGICEKCNQTSRQGFCDPIPAGSDPDNECTLSCNGARACQ